eukprot:CAMPEP_0117676216 /NCGR_PEP_ID=MMETSP0804-20121206/16036_1 /TAXON_ID=1074897 /ORGANISM="Tetraselmis astigmatica, Strain CCMP880" /LENGTH=30 /DNA_ID= /DNA_START= /DNA_END= /DNA_ORIENTATION=
MSTDNLPNPMRKGAGEQSHVVRHASSSSLM